MPAQVFIPTRFTTDKPELLRSELERLSRSLDDWTRGASELFAPRIVAFPSLNPTMLVLGQVVRVSLPDGAALNLQLPPPDRKHYGKKCTLLRRSATGLIRVYPTDALVGGVATYQMANDVHFVDFLLDDGDWYPSRAGGAIAL